MRLLCCLFPVTCSLAFVPSFLCASVPFSAWQGVDKTVIERVAESGGRPPRQPYINTDRGDLLLFLFLLAGAVGGFVLGYTFRALFPPRKHDGGPDAPLG